MNDPVVVVGAGPSAVHFAQSALERGRRVTVLDVGLSAVPAPSPDLDLAALKRALDDPVTYFLGEDFESLILPGHDGEYYGFPPSKSYVFEGGDVFARHSQGFAPLVSFASGGLAEAWTGGSYPFDERDLAEFPFDLDAIRPYYGVVAKRIGVSGAMDDLGPFFPSHDGLQAPLDLDPHSVALVKAYERRKRELNERHRFFLGRSRSAVLSAPLGERAACDRLGRCLWGCPTGAFYTPSMTLRQLEGEDGFEYVSGVRVSHFRSDVEGRIDTVVATSIADGARREVPVGTLVLAAGTIGSAQIFLESLRRDGAVEPSLGGLMDNRQVLMPFVTTSQVGRAFERDSYQYHQLAFALDDDDPLQYVHGLVTTLKTALIHPIVHSIPTSIRTAFGAFRDVHAALALANVNFADHRRPGNRISLATGVETGDARVRIEYAPPAGEEARMGRALRTIRRVLRRLGCIAPRGMTHVRPMGASVHYSGTLPMSAEGGAHTTRPDGRSRDFENLYVVDGSTIPWLPAKNLTFTLMANAARIADQAL